MVSIITQVRRIFCPAARKLSDATRDRDIANPYDCFIAAAVHFWSDAPFVRGGYTSPHKDEPAWARAAIQETHEGIVFFAGACGSVWQRQAKGNSPRLETRPRGLSSAANRGRQEEVPPKPECRTEPNLQRYLCIPYVVPLMVKANTHPLLLDDEGADPIRGNRMDEPRLVQRLRATAPVASQPRFTGMAARIVAVWITQMSPPISPPDLLQLG